MNQEELRQYVIQNQDDKKAFYQYLDQLKANSHNKIYPNSLSVNDIEKEVLNKIKITHI